MSWIILVVSGIFEAVWATVLAKSGLKILPHSPFLITIT